MGIFSIDIIIFSLLTFLYVKIKNRKPDWFFPTAGLAFFLPPEEEDLKELRQDRENSQKKMNSFQKKKFSVFSLIFPIPHYFSLIFAIFL